MQGHLIVKSPVSRNLLPFFSTGVYALVLFVKATFIVPNMTTPLTLLQCQLALIDTHMHAKTVFFKIA